MGALTIQKAQVIGERIKSLASLVEKIPGKKGEQLRIHISKLSEALTGLDVTGPGAKSLLEVQHFAGLLNGYARLQVQIPPEFYAHLGELMDLAIRTSMLQVLCWAFGMPRVPPGESTKILIPGKKEIPGNPLHDVIYQYINQVEAFIADAIKKNPDLGDVKKFNDLVHKTRQEKGMVATP